MRKTVLVGVVKSKDDLRILLEEKWYRIPLAYLPKKKFTHLAFYQPLALGKDGKRIEYYARVLKREVKRRIELLPHELSHPRANESYLKCSLHTVEKLKTPIRNVIPRRVSFGFTDLKTLRSAKDILELYHVAPTEQLIEQELKRLGIPVTPQHRVSLNSPFVKGSGSSPSRGVSSPPRLPIGGQAFLMRGLRGGSSSSSPLQRGEKRIRGASQDLERPSSDAKGVQLRYEGLRRGGGVNSSFPKGGAESSRRRIFRLDLAIFCKDGNLAIECDNRKAHSGKLQKLKDKQKDVALKNLGWRVIRLTEKDILDDIPGCITKIQIAIRSLHGTR